jgi:hypothetical protein
MKFHLSKIITLFLVSTSLAVAYPSPQRDKVASGIKEPGHVGESLGHLVGSAIEALAKAGPPDFGPPNGPNSRDHCRPGAC